MSAPLLSALILGTLALVQGQFGQSAFGQFGANPFFPQTQQQSYPSDNRLEIEVVKHQPCRPQQRSFTSRSKTWNWAEKVRFPSSKYSRLVPDPVNRGCYSIRGDIQVNQRLSNRAQIYLMVHYSVDPAEGPERCTGYDASGCGGWGSCLYCDACRTLQEGKQRLQAVSLTKQGRQVNCYEDLPPGVHQDVELRFCMPTKNQFLKNQGWTEQTWNQVVGTKGNGREIGVFLTITIFDTPQNDLLRYQRYEEQSYRAQNGISAAQKIPMSVQRYWKFYDKVVRRNSGFVGCHRIYGNLKVSNY